jgi:phosphocarrier protein
LAEVKGSYKIINKLGMHARAAAVFVQKANEYTCEITLRKGGLEASGKSIMSVLTLATIQGETIEIIANGVDSTEALEALAALIAERFGEDE